MIRSDRLLSAHTKLERPAIESHGVVQEAEPTYLLYATYCERWREIWKAWTEWKTIFRPEWLSPPLSILVDRRSQLSLGAGFSASLWL